MTMARDVREAYGASSAAWARGPDRIYGRMAEALVKRLPVLGAPPLVVDLGAGTGAVSRAALAAGCRVIAVDLAIDMLRHRRLERPPAIVADAAALPLRDRAVDAVLAGFSLSHLPHPERALAEAGRVTRRGGAFLAATLAVDGPQHASKQLIDAVAASHGFHPPAWYLRVKEEIEPLVGQPERLRRLATTAGLTDIRVERIRIDAGVTTAAEIVDYRLGMAHLAPFVASLDGTRARDLRDEALAAVGPRPEPVRTDILILSSRVAA